jgi:biopolymer transport protein ExbD
MKCSFVQISKFLASLIALLSIVGVAASQNENQKSKPVVLSVQMEHGMAIYRLNGRTVEDRRDNSLLKNLTQVAAERGTNVPVFVIIDVQAPFAEVGKLETALDKVDLTSKRRLFVTDYRDRTMNEIHWDEKAVPIPQD